MTLLGLHWIDVCILLAYVVAVLAIGRAFAHSVKGERDFFLGGRSLGRWFQFFLSFGNMTDPGQATTTASSVYSQGAGGAWLALITLFLTPYYWFTNVWFRRVRLTTTAQLFEDRFGGQFLATFYAVTTILMAIVTIASGDVVALKTLQPLMVKAPAAYTATERRMVAEFGEFEGLRKSAQAAPLAGAQAERYSYLQDAYTRGELQPFVTYLHPESFYILSSALVAMFIMIGGLKASAVVDALQTTLVIIISVILIPFGLSRIGGLHALHAKVPAVMFNLFGGDSASEYTWYSIGALLLVQWVGILGSQANMTIAGSATDEYAARLGAVTGGFGKRFVTIAWAYCGLIAVALFGRSLSDPDQTWGLLTNTLLPVGLIGVMIVGILGGKLALLGGQSVVLSGLVVKNLYEPLWPGRSERHYMVVARLTVPVILACGIVVALYLNSVIALLKFAIVLLVIWGVPITLLFVWRRLTEVAVRVQVIATLLLVAVIPWVVPIIPSLAQAPALTVLTQPRLDVRRVHATADDVATGRAHQVGDWVNRTRRIEPVSVYFEEGVVRVDPHDPHSALTGIGLFRAEVYLVAMLGIDVRSFSPAALMTTRYVVDAVFPLVVLIVVSLLTRPTDPERLARFYVRMKTPVARSLEADAAEVAASYANPGRFDHQKLFPRSQWEFTRWNRQDAVGFIGSCALVGFVLVFFKLVLVAGS
ncbi:MAG TPA: hypothetical protein VHE61_19490 [Opitutaceae bacterium]|nr:hypothetical protein [Opitutaceae bacterium]